MITNRNINRDSREDQKAEREYEDQYYTWYHNRERVRASWPYWIHTNIFRQSITFPLAPDRWQNDSSVSTLVSMIRMVEDTTEQSLREFSSSISVEAIAAPVLSRAKLAVPSFFFTAQPPIQARERHQLLSHDQDVLDDPFYPDMYGTWLSDTHWHTAVTQKFGIALRRASRESNNLHSDDDDGYAHYDTLEDNHFSFSPAAPANALKVALSAVDIDTCSEHGLPPDCDLASTPSSHSPHRFVLRRKPFTVYIPLRWIAPIFHSA